MSESCLSFALSSIAELLHVLYLFFIVFIHTSSVYLFIINLVFLSLQYK